MGAVRPLNRLRKKTDSEKGCSSQDLSVDSARWYGTSHDEDRNSSDRQKEEPEKELSRCPEVRKAPPWGELLADDLQSAIEAVQTRWAG